MVVFRKLNGEVHDNAKLKQIHFATYKVYCVCDGCDWEYAGAVGYGEQDTRSIFERWEEHVNAIGNKDRSFGEHFATKHSEVGALTKQQRANMLRFELDDEFAPTAVELKNRNTLRKKIRCLEQALYDQIPEKRRINRRNPADKALCPS